MKRIGIYGGAFNPPHIGHLRGAQYAVEALQLTKLLLIPTSTPPHKLLPENSASPRQRLDMLTLCFAPEGCAEVSDLELRRGGISYTYQTVSQLRQQYPDDELILLMGTDMFLSFSDWKNPREILQNASLAVFGRGEAGEKEKIAQQKAALEEMGGNIYWIDMPVTAVSSTDLRRMLVLRGGDSLLPEGVAAYIRKSGLYDTGKDLKNLSIEKLEEAVVGLLKPERVNHVLGCSQTAAELALHWGADEIAARRAGLLHDITKALPGALQLTLCKDYGIIPDAFFYKNTKPLHALTGALVAERVFGESPAVVEAVRWHCTGKPNMNLLEKIIYVADAMEPNRKYPGVELLRSLAKTNIDKALKCSLEMTLEQLRQQGRDISAESEQTMLWLQQNGI